MHLLTWHGTLLRVEVATQRLIHAPPHPQRPTGRDFVVPPAAAGLQATLPLPNAGGLALAPGPFPGTLRLMQGEAVIAAHPGAPDLRPEATGPADTERTPATPAGTASTEIAADPAAADMPPALARTLFAAISPETLAALRLLLGAPYGREPGAPPLAVALRQGFVLEIDGHAMPIAAAGLLALPDGGVIVGGAQGGLLVPAGPAYPVADLGLAPAPPLPLAPGLAELTPGTQAMLTAPARPAGAAAPRRAAAAAADLPELAFAPLAATLAGRDWAWGPAAAGGTPATGTRSAAYPIRRVAHAYALGTGGAPPLIFTEAGILGGEAALPGLCATPPDGFSAEGRTLFAGREALAAAPYLTGAHVLPWPDPPATEFQLLTEVLPALLAVRPHLPKGASLWPPPAEVTPPFRLAEILGLMGLGDMPMTAPPEGICQVEELWHLAPEPGAELPAALLREVSRRARAALGFTATLAATEDPEETEDAEADAPETAAADEDDDDAADAAAGRPPGQGPVGGAGGGAGGGPARAGRRAQALAAGARGGKAAAIGAAGPAGRPAGGRPGRRGLRVAPRAEGAGNPPEAAQRVLVWRRGGTLANQPAVTALADTMGLTVLRPGGTPLAEQARSFANARLVIGMGARDLGLLMLSPPGIGVIELCPEETYSPALNTLCNKLGLMHAVLPCGAGPGGALRVPTQLLRTLIDMLSELRP